eukprot:TRINITY_DN682_c0_g2_i1.p1 TRINITY_DN682_c0_g2~~TRINITY_DN682_c0_g2_i1.p1  ORF type:complete len:160 (+),score=4.73 TRINITY_DN682_c0_g2_i1:175-654(+)
MQSVDPGTTERSASPTGPAGGIPSCDLCVPIPLRWSADDLSAGVAQPSSPCNEFQVHSCEQTSPKKLTVQPPCKGPWVKDLSNMPNLNQLNHPRSGTRAWHRFISSSWSRTKSPSGTVPTKVQAACAWHRYISSPKLHKNCMWDCAHHRKPERNHHAPN